MVIIETSPSAHLNVNTFYCVYNEFCIESHSHLPNSKFLFFISFLIFFASIHWPFQNMSTIRHVSFDRFHYMFFFAERLHNVRILRFQILIKEWQREKKGIGEKKNKYS